MQIQWSLSSWSGLCERWNNNIHLWRCLGPFTCIMKKSGLLQHHCNRSYVAVEEGVVGLSSTFHKSSNFLPPVKLSAQVKHGLQGTHTLVLHSASILLIIHWNTHFTPQRKYLYVQQLITLSKMSGSKLQFKLWLTFQAELMCRALVTTVSEEMP